MDNISKPNQFLNLNNQNSSIDIKKEIYRYLHFWKFFVLSVAIGLFSSFIYLKYTTKLYVSTAKIMIVDKKESQLELPSISSMFKSSEINIDNQLEIIKSSPILEQVGSNLKMYFQVYRKGNIMKSLMSDYPFDLSLNISQENIISSSYFLGFNDEGFIVYNLNETDNILYFPGFSSDNVSHNLPFEITNFNEFYDLENSDNEFIISLHPLGNVVKQIKSSLELKTLGNESEIIHFNYLSSNYKYSERILNEIIRVFNNDGVSDRQLIHKRTIEFVNERYVVLSSELDSIEVVKKIFKSNNALIDFQVSAKLNFELLGVSKVEIFKNENQIAVVKMLLDIMKQPSLELLPSNIGIDNLSINTLITDFNNKIIEQKKIVASAGINNPSKILLDKIIKDIKENIFSSLQNYIRQLNKTKEKLLTRNNKYDDEIFNLPEKEKFLRSVERTQKIKESLYLFLLTKREEAEVSYAITEPSIKIIEYAISNKVSVFPKKINLLIQSFLFFLLLPILILYLIFISNTKIQTKFDIDELNLGASVIGEIPQIIDGSVLFDDPTQRSVLAEAFRMLSSNLKYMLTNIDSCKVIISTSTIKGEGKTFSAVNTSLALSSLNKKVLLIGCDLRNPQLHKYINLDKSVDGLVNYLVDNNHNWRDSLQRCFENHPTHHVLLSGALPPNPVQLLNNGNLEKLLSDAKNDYDYIILDTAPTILVTDTITIAQHADAILYVSRSNLTEKEVLTFPKELISSGKFKNVGFIINGLGAQNKYGYSYGYQYGYGYKYSYNYGYGYGYEEDKS